ncbi:NAD(P)H-binding protein [Aurantibacter sp.]|uniref:NAD(P)-dependent oxidoreductase n=1 Tax=Aurantibacter sp. TaxID=2807103 RepID=UPI003265AEA1
MNNTIKVAVIGGSGKSGRYLVQQLLKSGFELKALVRTKENFKINSPKIVIVYGDVRDYATIHSLINGCSIVISTLGGTPLSEPSVFSQATKNILRAMSELNLERYIVITGLNVDTKYDKKGSITQAGTDWMYANFPESTKDRQYEYELLEASSIDWTLVRLPLIIMTDEQQEVKISLEDCLGDSISSTDLADFLIEQIDSNLFIKKAPFIAN